MLSPVSVCLSVNSITKKTTDQIFMTFYGTDVHHHRHIYFRLPERPQKPIELATIKQHKQNCKNEKKYKKVIKMILKI